VSKEDTHKSGDKPMNSTGPKHPKEPSMIRRMPSQDVRKFLAGAFFVNTGILFYLYLARVSVPLLGTNFIETPEISGMRSVVHAVLFLTFFYLGFIRRWKRHSITTPDQDNEKIREVVTTWLRATEEGNLETVLSLIAEDAVFLLPDQPPMRGREAFAGALRSALGQVRIEGKPDIQEIHVAGDYAFCWNELSLTATPLQGGPAQRRAGPTLSVFRKERVGRWILFRDANMLKTV
jgi:uncharacterized protein (TIGR02246 family)